VKILDELLATIHDSEELIFKTVRGRPVNASVISSIVQRAAADAGIAGNFASHSLRIGGATASMGVLSLEEIKSIGHWRSDAVNAYLRSVGAARNGASRKMGL
jgi:spore maturation protein SpmA